MLIEFVINSYEKRNSVEKFLINLKKSEMQYGLELYANSENEAKILALEIVGKESQLLEVESMRRPSKKNLIISLLLIFGSMMGMFLVKSDIQLFILLAIIMWTGLLIAQWKILRESLNAIFLILWALYTPVFLFTTINDIPLYRFINYFFN